MSLDQLFKIGVTGIVLVNTQGYRHFVVLRGVRDGNILLADPAIGSITVPREQFEAIWDGTVLAARANIQVARENFNSMRDWEPWPTAPITRGVDRSGLGMFVLSLPGRNEFGR
jgi:predicted double-glycine peptidase